MRNQLSLWARISRQTYVDDTVSVCYRLPDQEEVVAEAFFWQLEEASCLQTLVLVGHFSHQRFFPASSILWFCITLFLLGNLQWKYQSWEWSTRELCKELSICCSWRYLADLFHCTRTKDVWSLAMRHLRCSSLLTGMVAIWLLQCVWREQVKPFLFHHRKTKFYPLHLEQKDYVAFSSAVFLSL